MEGDNDKKYMCRICPRQDDDYSAMTYHVQAVHGRSDFKYMIIEIKELFKGKLFNREQDG